MADEISAVLKTFLIYLGTGFVLGAIFLFNLPVITLIIMFFAIFQWLSFYMIVVIPYRNGKSPSMVNLFLMSVIILIPVAYICYRIIDNEDLPVMKYKGTREAEEYAKKYQENKRSKAKQANYLNSLDTYISNKKEKQDEKPKNKYGF
jgi:uncharacterized membrane protein (DUF106 family)